MTALRGASARPDAALWWPALVDSYRSIPPFPGAEVVRPAVVPEPPKLPPGTLEQRVLFLARAYRTACLGYYPFCAVFKDRPTYAHVSASKYAPALEAAVPKFEEHGMSPVAWCAFSAHSWQQRHDKSRRQPWQPPLKWVFSFGRLDAWEDWFAWSESRFRGGRMIVTHSHRQLLKRYERMRTALINLNEPDEDSVLEIVNEHLPSELYKSLVKQARLEADVKRAKLSEALARGDFLW